MPTEPEAKVLTLSGEKVLLGVFGPGRSSPSDTAEPCITEGNPIEETWSSILELSTVPVVMDPILFLVFESNDPGDASDAVSPSFALDVVRARRRRLSIVFSSSVVENDPE